MNTASEVGFSLNEIVGGLIATGVFITFCIGMAFRFQGKFTVERTLTTTEVSTLRTESHTEFDKLRTEVNSKHKELEASIRKVETENIALKEFFRQELDKKSDAITNGMQRIEALVNNLAQTIAAKYVERSEIDLKHARLEERVTVNEQGVTKMVSQNDQMLGLLAQIRLDSRNKGST